VPAQITAITIRTRKLPVFDCLDGAYNKTQVPKKKTDKITIEKDKLRPRPRAPILPSKKFEDKRRREERREKHKKDIRRASDEE
jgi:hypothetical protein